MWTTRNRTVNLHVCTHYTQTHVVNSNNKSVIKSSICPWENVALFPSSGLFRITKQLEEVVFIHRVDALLLVKGISALSREDSKRWNPKILLSIDISMKNISLYQLRWPKFKLEAKGCLSLFSYFIDMSPTLMSPFFVKKWTH